MARRKKKTRTRRAGRHAGRDSKGRYLPGYSPRTHRKHKGRRKATSTRRKATSGRRKGTGRKVTAPKMKARGRGSIAARVAHLEKFATTQIHYNGVVARKLDHLQSDLKQIYSSGTTRHRLLRA